MSFAPSRHRLRIRSLQPLDALFLPAEDRPVVDLMRHGLQSLAGDMILAADLLDVIAHDARADWLGDRTEQGLKRAFALRWKPRRVKPSPLARTARRDRYELLDIGIEIGSSGFKRCGPEERNRQIGEDVENPVIDRVIILVAAMRRHRAERIGVAHEVRAVQPK